MLPDQLCCDGELYRIVLQTEKGSPGADEGLLGGGGARELILYVESDATSQRNWFRAEEMRCTEESINQFRSHRTSHMEPGHRRLKTTDLTSKWER